MSLLAVLGFLLQVVRISVPYVLASLGGLFSERGGVVNIALEGILLAGAFGAVLGAHATDSALAGLGIGVAAGVAVAAILGLVAIRFRADAIVAGVAANILVLGATRFFLKLAFDSSSNSPRVEALEALAGARGGLAAELAHPLVLAAVAAVVATHVVLSRTRFGLRLRACGEHPEAAHTLGVPVRRVRWTGVLVAGALGGLGGVWLAVDQLQFTDAMSNGRGYIALAALVFGRWRPLPVAGACLLFGAAEALQIALQGQGTGLPPQLVQALPYVVTIGALVALRGKVAAPAALGRPFHGE